MTVNADTPDPRKGQSLRGSGGEWSQRRLAANLSISELARRAGLARSIVGLIDQGRVIPSPGEAEALLHGLGPETPTT